MKLTLVLSCLLAGLLAETTCASDGPLKVFVLVGQSNMQGHADIKTFPHIGMDPKTAPLLREIVDESGEPRICDDVWISYLSTTGVKQGQLTAGFGASEKKIGPELTFGTTIAKRLVEPALIIKAAWGGKSLHTDFRPPSGGPYQFSESEIEQLEKRGKDVEAAKKAKAEATGHYYRLTVAHVKSVLADIKGVYPDYKTNQGYELAGLVWFQGWNDMVDRGVYPTREQPGGYDTYTKLLADFVRDIRRDLSAESLPVVVGVMGVGGPVALYSPERKRHVPVHQNFRSAMAAVSLQPEFRGTVSSVLTEKYWDAELVALKARETVVKQAAKSLEKEKQLSRNEAIKNLERLLGEQFSASELLTLRTGISNAEYHYLGSSKIMAQIGQAFANAILAMDAR